ncbi:MAG: EamA family transporter RarD [Candidatus Nanopelagicaceae bacterium]
MSGTSKSASNFATGVFFGVSAYAMWGLLPLYWQLMDGVPATEILVHRGLWALVICVAFLMISRKIAVFWGLIKDRRMLSILAFAALLLTGNWGVYIWSVTVDRVVESALGYYITPLMSVTFGVLILKEEISKPQRVAIALAGVGVLILTIGYGALPWIALALSVTWGGYSLIKKQLKLGALESLSVETLIALIPSTGYIIYLASRGEASFGTSLSTSLLLMGGGLATVVPLLFFNGATNRLPLVTVGLLQYLTPTIMFFIGIGINREDMNPIKLFGFAMIWLALFVFGRDLVRSSRAIDYR